MNPETRHRTVMYDRPYNAAGRNESFRVELCSGACVWRRGEVLYDCTQDKHQDGVPWSCKGNTGY